MAHNYGLPYKGSKNTIAERIVECLPSGGRFLDACCGGGAISHAAYLSGRYASVTGYDINRSIITLLDAVMVKGGQIDYEGFPLVTMEEFYEAKDRWDDGNLHDAVIRYVASFGFNGQDYLWGKDRLQYKYIMHNVVNAKSKFERREALRDLINVLAVAKIPYDSVDFKNLAHIEQIQNLYRIKCVEDEMMRAKDAIACDISFSVSSMFDICYEKYDVCYFDPPYKSAQRRYNHKDFSQIVFKALLGALKSEGKTVFVSEYENPDENLFTEVASFKKSSTQAATVNKSVTERLFFMGTADDYKKLTNRDVSRPVDIGQTDGEVEIRDDSSNGVRPAAGGEQCPETDAIGDEDLAC